MHWCEAHQVDYVLGLAKHSRLIEAIAPELEQARCEHERTGEPARVFADFLYSTRKSWSTADMPMTLLSSSRERRSGVGSSARPST